MFYYLRGELVLTESSMAVIDCSGVGYCLTVSRTTSSALARLSDTHDVKLLTHLIVREDGVELYGFKTNDEQSAFKLLITVSGIGPKAAMSILSLLTPDKLCMAITGEDTKTIAKAHGIGAKTAARVVLELKDKITKLPFAHSVGAQLETPVAIPKSSNLSEALDALVVLGYSRAEAQRALGGIDPRLDVTKIIPLALAKLMK